VPAPTSTCPIASADALYEELQLDRLALVWSEHQLRKRPEHRFDVVFRQQQVDSGCNRISDWGAIRIRIEDLLDKHQRVVAAVANFASQCSWAGSGGSSPARPRPRVKALVGLPHHGAVAHAKGVCLFEFRELVNAGQTGPASLTRRLASSSVAAIAMGTRPAPWPASTACSNKHQE
jgi:hypothetical protein